MPNVNVYRNIDTDAAEFVETISQAERDARVATMTNVDPAGMPAPYSYRDTAGTVWGFAEAATGAEIASALGPKYTPTPEQQAADAAMLRDLFGA